MRNLTVAGGIGAGAATLGAFGAVVGGFGSLWAGDIAAFVGSRGSRLPVHPAKRPADARGRYVLDVGAEFTSRLTDSQGDYGPEALREHFLGPMAERLAQGEVEIDLSNVTEISPDFAEKAFAGMGASLTDEQARRLSFKGPQAQAAREALAAGLQQSAETSFQRLASLSGQIREAAPEARAVMPPHPDKAHPDKARPAMPGPAGL